MKTEFLISPELLTECERNARAASLGGRSEVRGDEARAGHLTIDQLVGQLCHAAGSLAIFGSLEPYRAARAAANADPWKGDGGSDFPGYPIDVKGSLMRYSADPRRYCLPVRPRERTPGTRYVLALARQQADGWVVHVPGWCEEADLPAQTAGKESPFSGAFVLPSTQLRPLPLPLAP